jgi:hypothetical protein
LLHFSWSAFVVALFLLIGEVTKVFNTTVENAVEKHETILVSDSGRDGLALCTGASAGTFVLQPSARGTRVLILN